MTTILFVVWVAGTGPGITAVSQEFADYDSCRIAATAILERKGVAKPIPSVLICTPKTSVGNPMEQLRQGVKKK